MTPYFFRLVLRSGIAICLLISSGNMNPLVAHARAAAQTASNDGEWVFLGTVADAAGKPEKWLGDTGFVFVDADNKSNVVPRIGDRIRLTTVKEIRKTNPQGQRPFERPAVQGDTTGEFQPGTVLKVLEIGRRPMSKAGDRWQCWVRVQR